MNEVILGKLNRIEAKLDKVIAALHDYDDDGYGESSFEAFMDTKQGPCSKHDEASWDEEETNKRMDIIGQNGNEGIHYVSNEEADEDAGVGNLDLYKLGYDLVLNSGMFFEIHPKWTGEWEKDKEAYVWEVKYGIYKNKNTNKDKSSTDETKSE
jgi:hypothetical protein